jgi:hypothetical protein
MTTFIIVVGTWTAGAASGLAAHHLFGCGPIKGFSLSESGRVLSSDQNGNELRLSICKVL